MKIDAVETVVVSLPERRRHLMSTIKGRVGEYVIVKVRTDDGKYGIGEATVIREWGGDFGRYYGEDPQTTRKVIEHVLAPALMGEDPRELEIVLTKLDQAIKGYPYAKASLDIALHDLLGKLFGLPVYQLLGGAFRDRIPIAHSLGILELDPLLKEVEAALEEGVKTIKLKAGIDTNRDVAVVKEVRKLAGPTVDITVDANNGWPDAKTAIQAIKRMEEHRVLFVEQPVEGLDAMSEVAHSVETHIMADESAWTARDIFEIARRGAADVISLYTTKPGGLHRAMKAAAVAEAAGLPCNVNGSAETGVGNAANLHLAAAAKVVTHACVLPVSSPAEAMATQITGRFYLDDVITHSFNYVDGALVVPTKPGLGIELDEEKIEKYRQEA